MSIDAYYPIGDNHWFYLFVIAVLEGLAIYLWQYRKMPGAILQICCQCGKGMWLLSLVMASVSAELSSKLFWISLQQMSAILLVYMWFLFIVKISQQEKQIPTVVHYLLPGIVILLWLIIVTNSCHGWYWREVWLDNGALKGFRGPAIDLARGFAFLLQMVNVGLGIRWIIASAGLRRQQALAIVMSTAITLSGYLVGLIPGIHVFSPQALGFLLSGIYITFVYRWWLIYNILPQVQKAVVQNMIDGLLVIDEQDYIVDINLAAKAILSGLPASVGCKYQEVVAGWSALTELGGNLGSRTVEVMREYPEGHRYYQLQMTALQNATGYFLGKIILLKDITEQKNNHAQLLEQQKALSIMTERDRLGRELHDGAGQLWSYINMQVEAARAFLDKKNVVQVGLLLEKLAGVTRDVHVDIRESITGLQTATALGQGFLQTLEEYLQWFRQNFGIDTELIIGSEYVTGALSPTAEVQVHRIIQEALTNIRKHAVANHVKVVVRTSGDWVEIRIEDNGRGFDLAKMVGKKGSFGLKIMRERAEETGARFQIQSAPGAGSKVIVQVPLAEVVYTGP